jgi:poly-beta-1,6-N-acetyl-D-glucosamine synthase
LPSSDPPTYAIVTATRDEAGNLPRLAACVAAQSSLPIRWVIVDTGSTDGTLEIADGLAARYEWITLRRSDGGSAADRGATVARAVMTGIAALDEEPIVLVNVDADISVSSDYFECLCEAFAADPRLGIASGTAYEPQEGIWRPRHTTRGSLWGASRAYRWECLQDVLPLEERVGWDGIDEIKARALGWQTLCIPQLRFDHHRREGTRDSSRRSAWRTQGELAHFMGYRISYLIARALFQSRSEPAALALLSGYAGAALRREARYQDAHAMRYLRDRQRLRELPLRAREALGRPRPL